MEVNVVLFVTKEGGQAMAKKNIPYVRTGKAVMDAIKNVSYRHTTWQVFQDFLAMSAISISNTIDWENAEKREAEYLEIVKRYNKEELDKIVQIFVELVREMTYEAESKGPTDILGQVFHGLELHNKYKGQFFTPFHICEFMGQITLTDNINDGIMEKEYISLCEPCVGSGGLVIGFASAMNNNKMDYQRRLCVTACDIDIKCVHMAYLQLGLYGIPAKIIHGNSLTNEVWSVWYTPTYMINGWAFKERRSMADIADVQKLRDEQIKKEVLQEEYAPDIKELENGQFCLF